MLSPECDELWGAPLESYVGYYTLDAAKKRPVVTEETKSEAQRAIRKVCRLGAPHGHMPDMEDMEAYWVSTTTLKSILKLADSPYTFSQLADPALITACVRMMASVMPAGRTSPFTYEFGYLCFRLITIVVGVSILERSGNLEMTIANMISDAKTELLLTFSGHVSRVIQEEYETPNDVDDCDWIIGWLEDPEHPTVKPLVGQQEIVLLMNMIWEDRKPFLSALSRTYSPGLSAVMFIFWRCMEWGRDLPIVERVEVPFREILWRYVLVATTDQVTPLMHIHNAIDGLTERWDETPKFVDIDDSRTVVNAYCARLAPFDTRMYSPIAISAIPAMLRFLVPHVAPEAQALLPLILGRTVERTWESLIHNEEDNEHFVDYLGKIMFTSSRLLSRFKEPGQLEEPSRDLIAQALAQSDLIELIARGLLVSRKIDVPREIAHQLQATADLMLSTVVVTTSRLLIGHHFSGLTEEFIKFKHHLSFLRLISAQSSPQVRDLKEYYRYWLQLARMINHDFDLHERLLRVPCHSPRCPDPDAWSPVRYFCDSCLAVMYCSKPCQIWDWENSAGKTGHKASCRKRDS